MCHQKKCNADPTPKNKKTAHPTPKTGPSTSVGESQDQQGAHQHEVVVRQASLGAATPGVRPHRP